MLSIEAAPRQRTDEVWPHKATGVWAVDNATGRREADKFMALIIADHNPIVLGHMVKSIMKLGIYDGVAVGFFNRISERIITSEPG